MSFPPPHPLNRIVCFMNRRTATTHRGAVERKDFLLKTVGACLQERVENIGLFEIIRVWFERVRLLSGSDGHTGLTAVSLL